MHYLVVLQFLYKNDVKQYVNYKVYDFLALYYDF